MKRALFALLLWASPVGAQGTDAVVTGNVLDSTGAVVPSAAITALNINTGVQKQFVLNQTTLRTGDHLEQNLTLEVGGTREAVQVTANADSVNYLNASQGGLMNSQRIQELPVTSRSLTA